MGYAIVLFERGQREFGSPLQQSRRAQELITISGVALTGSVASFTGNVEPVMADQVATKDKRFLVTQERGSG